MTSTKEILGVIEKICAERDEPIALQSELMEGDAQVARLMLGEEVGLPIFMWTTGEQLLCVVYLMRESEVKPETRAEMMEAMLDMNVPMPLSSFGKFNEHFVVFGALSVDSQPEVILQELVTLGENAEESLEAMSVYLK